MENFKERKQLMLQYRNVCVIITPNPTHTHINHHR